MDNLKVLLVDDSNTMRGLILRQLHLAGLKQVELAEDATSALEKLETGSFDLLLTDWNMPVISGLELVRMVREREALKDLTILMVTTRKEKEDVLAVIEARVDGYLIKPFGPKELIEKIAEVLGGEKEGEEERPLDAATIRVQVKDVSDLPAFPSTHQRLIEVMSQDDADVNIDELAQTLQNDLGLSMRIMRVARSAFFGFTGDYLKTALTYLGLPNVRQIVQSATILEVFKEDERSGLEHKGFWEHSLGCGIVMQIISRDAHHARHFMAGLLHDVGKLVLDIKFPEAYRDVLETAKRESRPLHAVELEKLGITHGEVGQDIVMNWQLPNEFAKIVAYHHTPSQGTQNQYASSLVYLADIAVRTMKIGNSGNPADPVIVDPYARRFGVPIEGVLERKDEIRQQVSALMGT